MGQIEPVLNGSLLKLVRNEPVLSRMSKLRRDVEVFDSTCRLIIELTRQT
jgi:hypothetical protein